jgi:peptide/nickel transport system permease protein
MSVAHDGPTADSGPSVAAAETTLRERVATNPRPALLWLLGVCTLLALEIGRFAGGIRSIGAAVDLVVDGVTVGPAWVEGNVAGTLGPLAGDIAFVLTAAVLLLLAAVPVRAVLPVSLVKTVGLERNSRADDLLEQALVAVGVGAAAVLIASTPVGALVDGSVAAITSVLDALSSLPTVTSREVIPNQGHRLPEGGWDGTFLGLSPAAAWAVRVAVVYAYAFIALAWAWVGYRIFREHYREADWTPRDDSVNRFRNHYWGLLGLVIVFAFVVMAVWAPALGPTTAEENLFSPYENEFEYLEGDEVVTVSHGTANLDSRSQGGDSTVGPMSYDDYNRWAPFGTNQDGKDLFTFLVFGARTSLVISLTAIGLATGIALGMSLITAYYKGVIDVLTVITSDTIISVPAFLMVLLLSVVFQEANHPIAAVYDGGLLLALIFAFVYWPGLWRSIRGPSLQVAEQEWVDAAKSYGQSPFQTMRKHMTPYIAGYIMIYASLLLGGIIIATAALSFLGLGVNPPTPEWGRMVSEGRSYISTQSWHIATIPGVFIVFVVMGFNALGDGIRDAIDPESDVGGDAATTGGGA